MEIVKPSLIESDTKFYLKHSLKSSRAFKDKYINIFMNFLFILLFIIIFGGILFYKYKGKLSPDEMKEKQKQKKYYLFKKLQQYALDKQKDSQNLITNLPTF